MFGKNFRKSIRYKFLKNISIILFVSTSVLSTVIAINEGRILKHSLMTKGQSFASTIAKLSPDPLIMKDSIHLDSIVNEAKKDEDIIYIIIQDAQGNLITSQYASINYQSPRLKVILSGLSKESDLIDIIAAIKKKESIVELSVPIATGTDVIGKVTICMYQHKIRKQILETILFVIALNLIATFVLGTVLFIASRKTILDPIIELSHAATRLAKGDLSTQVNIKTTGEIQMLVNSFNQMAEDLEKTTVSKDYVDSIIESMIDALIVVDPDGKIRTVNKATCDLLGHKEEELRGNPVEMIFSEVAEVPLKGEEMEKLIEEGKLRNYETYFKTKNGIKIPILFSSSVMKDKDNGINCILCLGRDITERKRAEEELKQKTDELARSNKELEQFAYVASHDLREPLRMVTSYVKLFARRYKDKLDADADDFINFAVDGATRMQRLIDGLLIYSRVGTRGKEFEPTDCEMILGQCLNNLQVAIGERGAVITHDPLPTVMADHLQLTQLFQNLIDNAIKFHGDEPPHIHVSCKSIEECKVQNGELKSQIRNPKSKIEKGWVFSVHDNGIGIAPEYADRIFVIFQRLHDREKYPGTGIGLAVCKKIVERHGGSIWVESEPGKGATFYFTIPAKGDQQP